MLPEPAVPADVSDTPRFSLLNRIGWLVPALIALFLLYTFIAYPARPHAAPAIAVVLLTAAALRPYESLLLIAGLGPLATIILGLISKDIGSFRMFEMLVLAFLAGWAGRHVAVSARLAAGPVVRATAWALAMAAVASGIVSATQITTEAGYHTVALVMDGFISNYPVEAGPLSAAMLMAEGALLLLAANDVCGGDSRRRDTLIWMLVTGAAASAVFNILRIVNDVAIPNDRPFRALVRGFARMRVNVHHWDINAAGSYFAMMLLAAIGAAQRSRTFRVIGVALLGVGLWLAGSRVAFAAVSLVGAIVFAHRLGRRRAGLGLVGGVLLVAAGAVAVWAQYPLRRHLADPSLATRIRISLAAGAVQMAADHPVFGVGLGRFFELSDQYARVPFYVIRENAHNNFLQILAELGITGLALFLGVTFGALAAARHSTDPPWALVAGICAFLLTCVGGHPLLVPHVTYPFWIAVGLAAVSPRPLAQPRMLARVAAAALVLFFLVTLPLRVSAAIRNANLEHTSHGLSKLWQREPEGLRYRWAGGRATVFVTSKASSVRIPLRRGSEGPETVEVGVFLDGREANRVRLTKGEEWRYVRLVLRRDDDALFERIDLVVGLPGSPTPLDATPTDAGGVIAVGRLILD